MAVPKKGEVGLFQTVGGEGGARLGLGEGGSKGFGSGGVGGRGTGPPGTEQISTRTKRRKMKFFEGCPATFVF